MPIYAYRCEECGFAKDVLQKMSEEPLSVCPTCGKSSFRKQVTAAGFQLKGSGWYVTDFRGGSGGAAAPAAEGGSAASTTAATGTTASATESSTTAASAPAAASTSDSGKAA